MIHTLLKLIIRLGIRIYYREIKILNRSAIPKKGPLIIISNHPNTLMDAWVVALVCKQPIYYMAKATFFDSKFKLWFFKKLKMVPINRAGEGKMDGVNNQQSFEECHQILENKGSLLIFPEGSSFQERTLRKLKSGTARIALDSEKRNNGELGLKVIAVGIHYSRAERFRSNLLISVDEPIEIAPYLEEYNQDSSGTARKLTQLFKERLEHVLFTTSDKTQEKLIQQIQEVLSSKYTPKSGKGVSGEVMQLREIQQALELITVVEPWKLDEISLLVGQIIWQTKKLSIKMDFLDRRYRSILFLRQIISSLLVLIIGAPLFIYGAFHNIIQYTLVDRIIGKVTKDVEYYAPLAILLGLIFYPLSYFGFVVLLHQFIHLSWWIKVIYVISMPASGLFAYYFYHYLSHISFKWHYLFLMISRRNVIYTIQKKRKRLKELITVDQL